MEDVKVFQDGDQLIFHDDDQVGLYAEKEDKVLLLWNEKVLDVTKFQYKHPGGQSVLENQNGFDVTEVFDTSYRHSARARDQLTKFEVGLVDEKLYTDKTENTFNFIKFTLIKNEPILSQVANLTPKQYAHLQEGKCVRQQLQTTKFFAEEDRESRLWVAPLTTQLIKIFMALSLLVHLKFNYTLNGLYVVVSLAVGYLVNRMLYASYTSHMNERQPTTLKQREFLFLMHHYQNIFSSKYLPKCINTQRQSTLLSHLPAIALGLFNVVVFYLSGPYKFVVLYVSLGQVMVSAMNDYRSQM